VTRVYVRDSLLINMPSDENTQRDAGYTGSDQLGKVFIVVGRDARTCLVCDGVFTVDGASAHVNALCTPRHGTTFLIPSNLG
jgi:hypothetical protein